MACRGSDGTKRSKQAGSTLTLGAYTTPREVYTKVLIPAFERHWQSSRGTKIEVRSSFLASGAQARAIAGGFEADIAALSLAADIELLEKAGLLRSAWRQSAHNGIVSRSLVVIGVRRGNPRGIRSWDDLAKPGLAVLTANPRTSGGAMWNLAAIWGAAWRGKTGATAGDEAAAMALLRSILRNVTIMDRSGRDATLTFERGVGDALITYENEMRVGRAKGQSYEYIVPASTILIENPAAVVDRYASKHGVTQAAQAFVAFLHSESAQRAFAEHGGLRPVDPKVATEVEAKLPAVADRFTIAELGGWSRLQPLILQAVER